MLVANWQLIDVDRSNSPAALAESWERLVGRALVPAGLNAPQFLIPLFDRLRGGELLTAHAGDDLVLAMAMTRQSGPPGLLTSWVTPVSISGLPHLDRALGGPALEAALRHHAAPLALTGIPADGPFWEALRSAAPRLAVVEQWQRAALRPTGSHADWLDASLGRKRQKEYRRFRTRLSEQGRLESRTLQAGDDIAPWIGDFLDLEDGGWKGRRGTSLKRVPGAAAAFADLCRGMHRAGKLRFWSICLDGRPIAALFAVVEGRCGWLGKIAYDEDFAKYSPGVLVVLDATAGIFAEGLAQVDSCAIPGHPMIEHIWRDRIAMADVIVAAATVGSARFSLVVAAERLRRGLRRTARDALYGLTGRSRS